MIREIYVIDTETTGLRGYPMDRVVEIGISKVNLVSEEVTPVYESVVGYDVKAWPEDRRKAWIFDNSDLTLDEVKNAPREDSVAMAVQGIVRDRYMTSYNVVFDFLKFLNLGPWRLHKYATIVTDPMRAAKEFGLRSDSPTGYPKLCTAYAELVDGDPAGIDGMQRHRALSDTVMAGYVMIEMHRQGGYEPKAV